MSNNYEIYCKAVKAKEDSLIKSFEEETERIAGWYHPKMYKQLEEAAIKNGFKKLLVDSKGLSPFNTPYVKPNLTQDIVFFPIKGFLNHKKLMEDYDSNFSKEGAYLIFRHEQNHFNKQSVSLREKRDKVMECVFNKKINTALSYAEIDRVFYLIDERQTIVNDTVKNFESREKLIDNYARNRVYNEFLQNGEKSLTEEYKYENGIESFVIKPETLSEVSRKVKEIKEHLLNEYIERFSIYS